jgi:hypothetical protein
VVLAARRCPGSSGVSDFDRRGSSAAGLAVAVLAVVRVCGRRCRGGAGASGVGLDRGAVWAAGAHQHPLALPRHPGCVVAASWLCRPLAVRTGHRSSRQPEGPQHAGNTAQDGGHAGDGEGCSGASGGLGGGTVQPAAWWGVSKEAIRR